jgi:hypothetical protein
LHFPLIYSQLGHISLLEHRHENLPHILLPMKEYEIRR